MKSCSLVALSKSNPEHKCMQPNNMLGARCGIYPISLVKSLNDVVKNSFSRKCDSSHIFIPVRVREQLPSARELQRAGCQFAR